MTGPDRRREAAPGGPAVPRLAHEPALDGLRGLAVLVVVAFHLDRLQGGFLGVDLFFVLSGFLITSLLLVEHQGRGRVDLGAFWARRARRLLPALLALLAGVAVLLATLSDAAVRPRFRGDALATLGYVANWHRMVAEVSYWDIFTQPSPLDHTWSLAIEEQFYLAWPLMVAGVLAAGRGRWRPVPGGAGGGGDVGPAGPGGRPPGARRVAAVAVAGAAASFVALAVLWSPVDTNRAYFATDTRLGPILLGAALAAATAGRNRRAEPPPARRDAAAALALAAMGAACVVVDGRTGAYYRGGLVLFALASLVVVAGVTGGPPGVVARGLSWRPLARLGTISYGVYLWHWPVIVYLTPERLGAGRLATDVACVAVTLGLALLSARLVEGPVRRGALPGLRGGAAVAAVVAVVAVALVAVTRGPGGGGTDVAATSVGTVDAGGGERPLRSLPTDVPPGATRLLVVGDSGPMFLVPALAEEARRTGGAWAIGTSSILDCSPVIVSSQVRYPTGDVVGRRPCHERRRRTWAADARRMGADVVVVYLANAGGLGEQWVDGQWVTDCDPAFDELFVHELGEDVAALAATGARVVLASSPDVEVMRSDSNLLTACRNRSYHRVATDRPGTLELDLHGKVAELGRLHPGLPLLRDFVHLSEEGTQLVSSWMLPAVADLLRQAGPVR
ncbi:MAG TPA: acyltransferase [Acidimicrobiales bacterium]|nr:acyltransferase [Acidimicrobiales bacterium]